VGTEERDAGHVEDHWPGMVTDGMINQLGEQVVCSLSSSPQMVITTSGPPLDSSNDGDDARSGSDPNRISEYSVDTGPRS
jgi:hypothetical protein